MAMVTEYLSTFYKYSVQKNFKPTFKRKLQTSLQRTFSHNCVM